MEYEKFQENIRKWAGARNIDTPDCSDGQFLKMIEEWGETARGILRKSEDEAIDGLGDTFVTLEVFAVQQGVVLNYKFCEDIADTMYKMRGPYNSIGYATRSIGLLGINGHNTMNQSYIQEIISQAVIDVMAACFVYNYAPLDCMEAAWLEIKGRKGKKVGNVFVKDE